MPAGAALAAAAPSLGLTELGHARVLELRLLEAVDGA